MDSKRMRYSETNSRETETLALRIWQNKEISNCLEQNYLNRLLESTQTLAQHSEEIRLNDEINSQAIKSAISSIGLKKKSIDLLLDDSSDDSNSASTSTSFPNRSSPSTSSACDSTGLESIAIRTAINSFGLKK